MTTLSRRTRLLAAPVALALAAGTLGALAAPASAAKSSFASTTDIHVGDTGYTLTQSTDISIPTGGDGTPYPSELAVPLTQTIKDVNVQLNLSHTWPDDIDILLVGPGGQTAVIMSDVGDDNDINVTLTLDDEAAAFLPDAAQIVGGEFRPTNINDGADNFGVSPVPGSGSSLSVFDNSSPAGAWRLYARDDDGAGDSGTVLSWGLTFELASVPSPSTIDVNGLPVVTDVNVGIQGMTSEGVADLNLLLVGPAGQQSYLIGDSGGSTDISNVSIAFDDEAAAAPTTAPLVNGTSYKPSLAGDIETFDGGPVATGSTPLSVFDGVSPNGQWRLFSMDDANGELTVIGGWSLEFTWSDINSPTGLINIAGGTGTVGSTSVTLNLNANDPAPASGVAQMRFSNNGTTFSAYQPYATTAAWTLSGGSGDKTVYAQFKDADGNESAVVNDTIKLDVTGPKAKKLTPKKNAKGVKTTTKIKIKSSEALKKSTVTKKNVFLKQKGVSGKIKAKVKYDSAKKLIVLTPVDDLKGGKTYKVTVKNVQDAFGHKWDEKSGKSGAQALKYSFTTA